MKLAVTIVSLMWLGVGGSVAVAVVVAGVDHIQRILDA